MVKSKLLHKSFVLLLILSLFNFNIADLTHRKVYAQNLSLPLPNKLLKTSPSIDKLSINGLWFNSDNPLEINFLIDREYANDMSADEVNKVIEYFFLAITVTEADWWVNLSPYESDRIIPEELNKTKLGRDMLLEDYFLKQFSSSLTHPDNKVSQKYWDNNHATKSLSKIWIEPGKAELIQGADHVLIKKASLKLRAEDQTLKENCPEFLNAIEREINNGENFAKLRQLYNSLILASWFKATFKASVYDSLIDTNKGKAFVNKNDQSRKHVYDNYLNSVENGVYSLLRKETKNNTKQKIKYFSGGNDFTALSSAINVLPNFNKLSAGQVLIDKFVVKTLIKLKSSIANNYSKKIINKVHRLYTVLYGFKLLNQLSVPRKGESSFVEAYMKAYSSTEYPHYREAFNKINDAEQIANELNINDSKFIRDYQEFKELYSLKLNSLSDVSLGAMFDEVAKMQVRSSVFNGHLGYRLQKSSPLKFLKRLKLSSLLNKLELNIAKKHKILIDDGIKKINDLLGLSSGPYQTRYKVLLVNEINTILRLHGLKRIAITSRSGELELIEYDNFEIINDINVYDIEYDNGFNGWASIDDDNLFINNFSINKRMVDYQDLAKVKESDFNFQKSVRRKFREIFKYCDDEFFDIAFESMVEVAEQNDVDKEIFRNKVMYHEAKHVELDAELKNFYGSYWYIGDRYTKMGIEEALVEVYSMMESFKSNSKINANIITLLIWSLQPGYYGNAARKALSYLTGVELDKEDSYQTMRLLYEGAVQLVSQSNINMKSTAETIEKTYLMLEKEWKSYCYGELYLDKSNKVGGLNFKNISQNSSNFLKKNKNSKKIKDFDEFSFTVLQIN